MNIAVIGLGSMGKRRIRLIQEMYPDYEIIGIDGREDRRKDAAKYFGISCLNNLNSVHINLECVFVCTSPLSHSGIIKDALERGCHVFTELNLVSDGYNENIKLATEKKLKLFLSSTFLFREEIRYIRSQVIGEKWNYIYHIGQYLPDWHPWENYKDFFLGDKRTNGCREIMAIELPWLIDTFGEVIDYHIASSKMTELSIDYNDNFMLQFTHENGNKGVLVVDVASPAAVRKLEVYKENRYLSWAGTPETLTEYNNDTKQLEVVHLSEKTEHIDGYKAFIVENAYKNEIKEFFDVVFKGKEPHYNFERDYKILQLIDAIGA